MSKIFDIINGYANKTASELLFFQQETKLKKDKIATNRLDICLDCDTLDKPDNTCSSSRGGCGCNMNVKIYCTMCYQVCTKLLLFGHSSSRRGGRGSPGTQGLTKLHSHAHWGQHNHT